MVTVVLKFQLLPIGITFSHSVVTPIPSMVEVDLPTFTIKLNHSFRIHIPVPMILGDVWICSMFFRGFFVDWFDPTKDFLSLQFLSCHWRSRWISWSQRCGHTRRFEFTDDPWSN